MIIGICGLAGSGKNAVADFFASEANVGTATVAFADPLKRVARDVYDFTDAQLWGPSANRNAPDTRYPRSHSIREPGESCLCCGVSYEAADTTQCYLTPRYALQLLGTEWGRECYPDTWAALGVRTALRLTASGRSRYDYKKGIYFEPETREWTEADRQYAGRVQLVSIPDVRFRNEMRVIRAAGGKVFRVSRPGAGLKGSAGLHPSEVEQAGIPDSDFDIVIQNTGTLDALQSTIKGIVSTLDLERDPES